MTKRAHVLFLPCSVLMAALMFGCAYEREEVGPKREYEVRSVVVDERPASPTQKPTPNAPADGEQVTPDASVREVTEEQPRGKGKGKKNKKKKSKKNRETVIVPYIP